MKRKIIAMDVTPSAKGGGPYNSTQRIISSDLNKKYIFKLFIYDRNLGGKISIKRILDLKRQIQEIKPDIVHFSGLQLSGFHIAIAAKIAGVSKILLTVRGSSSEALDVSNLKKNIITNFFERITLFFCTKFYGVSYYASTIKILRYFKNKNLGYVHNFPPVVNDNDNVNIRSILGLSDDDLVVVSAGRIVKDKGYHILKDAIQELSGISSIKFVIIGNGDYLDEMKQKLATNSNTFFLGYRNNVSCLLKHCDVFILPTLHETLSNVLLEASANKLALIGTNVGGVPEIISDGYNGFLVEKNDIQGIIRAICSFYNNRSLVKQMGTNAKKCIDSKFSPNKIISEIDKIYQSLLND